MRKFLWCGVVLLGLAACGSTEPARTSLTGTWRDPALPASGPFVFVLTDRAGAISGTATGAGVPYTLAGSYDGASTFTATLTPTTGPVVAFSSTTAVASGIVGRLNGGPYANYVLTLSRDP